MESRYFYKSSATRRWPIVRDRIDYRVENDDPAYWYVTSSYFDAVSGLAPYDDDENCESTVEEGWWFRLPIDDWPPPIFRVVVDVPLSAEEEAACFARGRWPLLQVPCGALIIGECPFGVSWLAETEGSDVISVGHHDRNAVALVPPGNYAVDILQYLSGPTFLFHLTRLTNTPPCPKTMALDLQDSVPLEIQNRVVGAEQSGRPGSVVPTHLPGSTPAGLKRWELSYLDSHFDCTESMPTLHIRVGSADVVDPNRSSPR